MIEAEVLKMLALTEMSTATKQSYEFYCRDFFRWWFENNPDLDPILVSVDDVMLWLSTHPKWTSSTKHIAGSALKKFYRWKYGEHPLELLKIKRVDPGPQRTLDRGELLDVLSSIDTTTIGGIRDLAILSLMVDTGIRATEICNLEMDRLNLDKKRFTVKVKGGGIAEKLFFDYTGLCLRNWLVLRDEIVMKGVKNVFVSVGGKRPGTPLTRSGIRYLSKKMSALSGIARFSPHCLRRTFATLATENGAPSRVVQVAGGWKSIRMVERYTKALKPEAIAPFSPIDKLMND
ncbi:tyrosine-type recombinase/integrase [Ornatilinea apprima]|nr:site-specific integrase [Ornatilinea apprima]